jgi:hypothetical protein
VISTHFKKSYELLGAYWGGGSKAGRKDGCVSYEEEQSHSAPETEKLTQFSKHYKTLHKLGELRQ